jgi:hypothetical protein
VSVIGLIYFKFSQRKIDKETVFVVLSSLGILFLTSQPFREMRYLIIMLYLVIVCFGILTKYIDRRIKRILLVISVFCIIYNLFFSIIMLYPGGTRNHLGTDLEQSLWLTSATPNCVNAWNWFQDNAKNKNVYVISPLYYPLAGPSGKDNKIVGFTLPGEPRNVAEWHNSLIQKRVDYVFISNPREFPLNQDSYFEELNEYMSSEKTKFDTVYNESGIWVYELVK